MNMIGRWFPPSHDPDQAEMHHVLMLCLHKPWQELSLLKDEDESWKEAYDSFFQAAGASQLGIMANAQFYHECREAVDCICLNAPLGSQMPDAEDEADDDMENHLDSKEKHGELSEAGLEEFLQRWEPAQEIIHGLQALECAMGAQVFGALSVTWIVIGMLTSVMQYNHERDEEMK